MDDIFGFVYRGMYIIWGYQNSTEIGADGTLKNVHNGFFAVAKDWATEGNGVVNGGEFLCRQFGLGMGGVVLTAKKAVDEILDIDGGDNA